MLLRIFITLLTLAALAGASTNLQQALSRAPLSFEANRGQADPTARYVARGDGFALRFGDNETVVGVGRGNAYAAIRMKYRGAAAVNSIGLEDRLAHQANYFRGDRSVTAVSQFAKLRYRSLYPGIDLVFYGNQRNFEYDFVVAPGADPRAIDLEFDGAHLSAQPNGSLVLKTVAGSIMHHAPVTYQLAADGSRVHVPSRYRIDGRRVRFEVGSYDRSRELIIDPILQYSSYVGGQTPANNAEDIGQAIALDTEGNIYIAGRTQSTDLPLNGAIQTTNKGSGDAFVMKLDSSGKKILYATYLGGGSLEYAYGIAVDAQGQAHITGVTGSRDFPIKNAYQTRNTGLNIPFLTKLNARGDGIIFSTYFGGERNDTAYAIGLDRYGNSYIAGRAGSTTFPTYQALQPKNGGQFDGFIAKFNPEGQLQYSTLIGGNNVEEIYALAVDPDGNAYFAGYAQSYNLATPNAFQTRPPGPNDGFVGKLNPTGTAYHYITYLGGRLSDQAQAIAIDAAGNAYVAGYTTSNDFPVTEGVIQPKKNGPGDAFITKLNDTGSAVIWSTYLGGSVASNGMLDEYATAISVDADGHVYVAGTTLSQDFPVERAVQAKSGGNRDLFVAKLANDGTRLIFSTYLGGADRDEEPALAITPLRAVLLTGQTFSTDFPLESAAQSKRGSSNDGLLTRICDPVLFASSGRLDFEFTQGSTDLPKAQGWNVIACHDLPLELVVEGGDWFQANAATGKLPADVTIAVNPATLEPGDYTGLVTLTVPDTYFGPIKLEVRLKVLPPPPPPPPDPSAGGVN